MVGVLDTNNNFALASAAATLEQAEVIYDVVPIVDGPNNSEINRPKSWVHPSRILVSAEDEAEARALVEPFQVPVKNAGNEEYVINSNRLPLPGAFGVLLLIALTIAMGAAIILPNLAGLWGHLVGHK
jgi:hypothetical protein